MKTTFLLSLLFALFSLNICAEQMVSVKQINLKNSLKGKGQQQPGIVLYSDRYICEYVWSGKWKILIRNFFRRNLVIRRVQYRIDITHYEKG